MHRNKSPVKITLLCSNNLFRESLRIYLSSKINLIVTGDYQDADTLIKELNPYSFDILIMDFVLGKEVNDGLNMINAMVRRFSEIKILSFSSFSCAQTAVLAIQSGAKGFIETEQSLTELMRAVEIIKSGRIYLSTEIAKKISRSSSKAFCLTYKKNGYLVSEISKLRNEFQLTPKELEVARCLAQGLCLSEIAIKSSRSIKTVSGQKRSAMYKLGVNSTYSLIDLVRKM
ncbi:response regulator transcription factor [uncultured Deefgea sp.]|uniref:response regulator transcription factor n=1 Tax=uncultured Deefgea sp. TaxID=1304914 RepID=UPI0025960A70|nr:response regulator transcription factor [uncultured Deefgea sp.]